MRMMKPGPSLLMKPSMLGNRVICQAVIQGARPSQKECGKWRPPVVGRGEGNTSRYPQ
jgi:hypothetical protein